MLGFWELLALGVGAGQEQPWKVLPRQGGGRAGTTWGCGPHALEPPPPNPRDIISVAHREQPDPLSWLVSGQGENQARDQTETLGPACATAGWLPGADGSTSPFCWTSGLLGTAASGPSPSGAPLPPSPTARVFTASPVSLVKCLSHQIATLCQPCRPPHAEPQVTPRP